MRHISPELDRKNSHNKKETTTINQKGEKTVNGGFRESLYVSNLIGNEDEKRKTFRCDALMVNLVSNYFRRKMFKKHRKYDSVRVKTEGNNMISLSGEEIL